jgi:hypothetical protein
MSKFEFTPEHLATVERIRDFLASVPLAISKRGVLYLDFKAWRRGERRAHAGDR